MNMVAKLLLNSLYGRFGMVDQLPNTSIIHNLDNDDLIQEIGGEDKIDNIIDLDSHQLVQYFDLINGEKLEKEPKQIINNVNIAIASAVTAYARIHMAQLKNNPLFPNLYYTDTDYLYLEGPLPESFVDPKRLGALKLEGV